MMETPLLTTKLYVPQARPNMVRRARLTQRLDESLTLGHRLVLVSAPAGYGKTTLLSAWLHSQDGQHKIAWVSLDAGDNDPARFFSYMIAALQTLHADIGEEVLAALHAPQLPAVETLATLLINDLAEGQADAAPIGTPSPEPRQRLLLVLDDYHVITESRIHQAISFMIAHLPPAIHIVMATRADPPLPLARFRARGQISELRAVDLRFTEDEVTTLLNEIMGLQLTPADIQALETRTEGWIAGLQLAAFSMRGQHDAERFIAALTGSNRFILDYLVEEILHQQPQEIQDFLVNTSILHRLSGPLCDTLLRTDEGRVKVQGLPSSPSQEVLEKLEQENLFIVPLDNQRQWYRYHHLFGEFLRSRLHQSQPTAIRTLHRRAARWYEQQGLLTEAIEHAIKARDDEQAARLIEAVVPMMLSRGEVVTFLHWLDMLPEGLIHSRLKLSTYYAGALLIVGDLGKVEAQLHEAERLLAEERGESQAPTASKPTGATTAQDNAEALITAIRAYMSLFGGDLRKAITFAQRALDLVSEEETFVRSVVTWLLGLVHLVNESAAEVNRTYSEVIDLTQTAGYSFITDLALFTSGHLYISQGKLHKAEETFRQGLELTEKRGSSQNVDHDNASHLGASMIYQGLATLAREWYALDEAERYIDRSILLGLEWGNAEVLADSYIVLAYVKQMQDDGVSANAALESAQQFVHDDKVSLLTGRQIAAHEARLAIMQGNLQKAAQWAETVTYTQRPEDKGGTSIFIDQIEKAALARVWIAQERYADALNILGPLQHEVQELGWLGLYIEIATLQALAHDGLGQTDTAIETLQGALALAAPEGYIGTFVNEGKQMADLLRSTLIRDAESPYIQQLLAVFDATPPPTEVTKPRITAPPHPALIEPLSERETEVLHLIAAGLSNREIAEELYIAVSTVKTHINNLYRKLDVGNRAQAVARANELALL